MLDPAVDSPVQERHRLNGMGPARVTEVIKGLEDLSCKKRLRVMRPLRLERRRFVGLLSMHTHN